MNSEAPKRWERDTATCGAVHGPPTMPLGCSPFVYFATASSLTSLSPSTTKCLLPILHTRARDLTIIPSIITDKHATSAETANGTGKRPTNNPDSWWQTRPLQEWCKQNQWATRDRPFEGREPCADYCS